MAAMDSSAAQTRLLRRAQIRGNHGEAQWRVWKGQSGALRWECGVVACAGGQKQDKKQYCRRH